MLNAVNINSVAFSRFNGNAAGMVLTVFAIVIRRRGPSAWRVILLFRTRRHDCDQIIG